MIERGPDHCQAIGKTRQVGESTVAERVERIQPRGAGIGLGEIDIHRQRAHLIAVEGLAHQGSKLVAWPGPMAFGNDAFLVEIDNHHLRIDGAGHGEQHTGVVGGALEVIDQRQGQHAADLQHEHHEHRSGNGEADQPALRAHGAPF